MSNSEQPAKLLITLWTTGDQFSTGTGIFTWTANGPGANIVPFFSPAQVLPDRGVFEMSPAVIPSPRTPYSTWTNLPLHFTLHVCKGWSQDSSVCIATHYGLDGPGIESRWRRNFTHLSRPTLRPTLPPIQWVPGLSGGKAAGVCRLPPTPSSAEVKDIVDLYIYSALGLRGLF